MSHPFLLLGAGNRPKHLYTRFQLKDAHSGAILHAWQPGEERLDPTEARIELLSHDHTHVEIYENAEGLFLSINGNVSCLGSEPVSLPRFDGHPHAGALRALHHEILTNIDDGKPLPNMLVYRKPWHRDAAMMAMVLEKTGNLNLIRQWVLSLTDPYDYNNGEAEPDNLGQVLYLLSFFADFTHPLVTQTLAEVQRRMQNGYLTGNTDGWHHTVYQMQWLNFGLRSLGLPQEASAPPVEDSYAGLCWFYPPAHAPQRIYFPAETNYPYLTWAEAHFHRLPPPWTLLNDSAPLTWEAYASQAQYAEMSRVESGLVESKKSLPHTWHAAEAFCYLLELEHPTR